MAGGTFGSSAVITPNLSWRRLIASLTSAFFNTLEVAWWGCGAWWMV